MPRQPRYFLPDIPQHVIQRGVDRQPTFFEPQDYQLYRECLRSAAELCGCQIHAYVLMTNHTHLLITPAESQSIPLLMQAIGRTYVQTLNRRRDRTGTLWEGRYKASPIDSEQYLLICSRYIELNPVRAGMVRTPAAYSYSSFSHNAQGKPDPLITNHPVYNALADDRQERVKNYQRLFGAEIEPETLEDIRDSTNACLVLGNESFNDKLERKLGRSVRPGRQGRPRKTRDLAGS